MQPMDVRLDEVARRAGLAFDDGCFHCAEAVARTVLEAMGMDGIEAGACATAFGGGFGRSFQEACGALSGGLVAIGRVHGRREPGKSWDRPARLAAALREHFLRRFGTTNCGQLRERFGPETQMQECRGLVRETARALLELLDAEDRAILLNSGHIGEEGAAAPSPDVPG